MPLLFFSSPPVQPNYTLSSSSAASDVYKRQLLIVWLGTGMDTIIAAGISVAIFGAIINLYTGFLQADPKKLLLIRTLGGTRRDCFFKVVLPASIPVILSLSLIHI